MLQTKTKRLLAIVASRRLSASGVLLWAWLSFFLSGHNAAAQSARAALVIGNNAYPDGGRLENPVRDARAVATVLKSAGFDVVSLEDAKLEKIYEGLEELKQRGAGSRMTLVFYAGHGVEVDGKNYLLPVDAVLENPAQLRTQAVSLDAVLADIKATRCEASLVILDCCRNNPLARSWMRKRNAGGGLAEIGDAALPESTMIMFSAGPGQQALDGTGENSPFTAAFVSRLQQRGLSLLDAFFGTSDDVAKATNNRQEPWVKFDGAGRVFRELVFLPGASAPKGMMPKSPAAGPSTPPVGKTFTSPTTRQEFVEVGINSSGKRVLMCRWETRVGDWKKFATDPAYAKSLSMQGADPTTDWKNPFLSLTPSHEQGDTEPVVCISLKHARAYCEWLSERDGVTYRVPTDEEWSIAAALTVRPVGSQGRETLASRDTQTAKVFAWGSDFPPAKAHGNYFGAENDSDSLPRDGWRYTSPAGTFAPNRLALFDIGGNVAELCDTSYSAANGEPGVARGGSWNDDIPAMIDLNHRGNIGTDGSNKIGFRIALVVSPH